MDDFLNKGISLVLAILHPLGVIIDLLLVNRTGEKVKKKKKKIQPGDISRATFH